MAIQLQPVVSKRPEALLPNDVVVAKLDYEDMEEQSRMFIVVTIACNDPSAVFLKELSDDGTVDEEIICVDLNKTKYAYLGSYKPVGWITRWFCKNHKPYEQVYSAA